MKQSTVHDCKMVDIRRYTDNRGYLSVIEGKEDIPFDIKRVYYLYMVPEESRGAHAHKALQQFMVATSGSVHVTLDDGRETKTFILDKPWKGLLVVPGLWRTLTDFSGGTVCMVLASAHYDEADYIRDYTEFLSYKGQGAK